MSDENMLKSAVTLKKRSLKILNPTELDQGQ